MNKLYKILIAGLFTIGIGISFCSAEKLTINTSNINSSAHTGYLNLDSGYIYCLYSTYNSSTRYVNITFEGSTFKLGLASNPTCFITNDDNKSIYYSFGTDYSQLFYTKVYKVSTCSYSGYILESDVNQNYCVNNNLCPICEICNYSGYENSLNVCTNNLNTCQSSLNSCLAGNYTGLNWSALFLNGQQIKSNAIIDIYAEDYLKTDIEYLNDTVDIDISFKENTDYIENVINQEKLTPTKEDFETLLIGLAEFIPYLFIALLFFVIVKITRNIWR